jgi:rare lipoprotein A
MVIRRKTSDAKLNSSLRDYLLAGTTSLALAATGLATFFTGTVEANVHLARPLATLPPAPPAESVTPAMLAPAQPVDSAHARMLHGLASWYGKAFHGRRTASGEPFDMNALTACHPSLPFGSQVRVKNLRNKRSVVVRITDRGYLFDGRVIDLSFAAAQQLEMTEAGIAPVAIEVLSLGSSPSERKR